MTLLLGCYAMFGISLFVSVIIITLLWARLVTHKPGAAVMVPTLWIVLGPLGQSVTAAGNLGTQAAHVLPAPYARGRGRLRPPLWRADLGLRDDVAGAGRRDHGADRTARAAFCPNVVEFHVPRRHLCHRHHRPGRPQPG